MDWVRWCGVGMGRGGWGGLDWVDDMGNCLDLAVGVELVDWMIDWISVIVGFDIDWLNWML